MNIAKNFKKYIIFTFFTLILLIEIPIIFVGFSTNPNPSDTMIVLGAKLLGSEPSTMLRLRLDEALRLYNAGYAKNIIVSGAKGHDEEISEAESMKKYLIAKGIPTNCIFIEDNSFNTYQNLVNSKAIMDEHQFNTAIIVSNSSHIRRSLVLAQSLGINATGSPAPMADNAYLTTKQYLREGAAMLSLMVFNK